MTLSIVRENLMTRRGYTPYCGADPCPYRWPRTRFDGEQFACRCGWRSGFEPEFIAAFKARWASGGSKEHPALGPANHGED